MTVRLRSPSQDGAFYAHLGDLHRERSPLRANGQPVRVVRVRTAESVLSDPVRYSGVAIPNRRAAAAAANRLTALL
jgi:hypothetical protein